MLYDFIMFLPASICLMYAMMLSFRYKKNSSQIILMLMMLFTAVYTLGDAIYIMPSEQYGTNVAIDIFSALTTPFIPILAVVLLHTLLARRVSRKLVITLVVIEVIYASMLLMSVLLAGPHDLTRLQAALVSENRTFDMMEGLQGLDALPLGFRTPVFQFYLLLTRPVYYGFILVGALAVLVYISRVIIIRRPAPFQFCRFVFKGGPLSSFYLVAIFFTIFAVLGIFRIVSGLDIFRMHMPVAIAYSLLEAVDFYLLGAMALLLPARRFYLRSLYQPFSFSKQEKPEVQTAHQNDSEESRSDAPASLPDDAGRMLQALKKLMEDDQLFLNPDLTIEDVATELNTNRVYISRIVNQLMHVTFRDYVNQLRIRYSKQYMRKHPEYTQETVAVACGYQDAASFNRKFRQITGLTPREWVNRKSEDEKPAEEPSK